MVGLTAVIGAILLLQQINNCGSALVPDLTVAQFTDILSDIYGTEAHCIEVLAAVTNHPWAITCIGTALIVAAIIARLISSQPTGAELVPPRPVRAPEKLDTILLMVNLSTRKLMFSRRVW